MLVRGVGGAGHLVVLLSARFVAAGRGLLFQGSQCFAGRWLGVWNPVREALLYRRVVLVVGPGCRIAPCGGWLW